MLLVVVVVVVVASVELATFVERRLISCWYGKPKLSCSLCAAS